MTRKFGFELEVNRNGRRMLALLRDMGGTDVTEIHPYHCECEECDYSRVGPIFTVQADVGGEFITKILRWQSVEAEGAIEMIADAARRSRAGVSHVGGRPSAGLHVHVSHEDLSVSEHVGVMKLFNRYAEELRELASSGAGTVRRYNAPPQNVYDPEHPRHDQAWGNDGLTDDGYGGGYDDEGRYYYMEDQAHDLGGTWLRYNEHVPTFEFRLWNATRQAWRIRMCAGLSVAMVEAAKDGVTTSHRDNRLVEEVLLPYLSPKVLAGVLRQRAQFGIERTAA